MTMSEDQSKYLDSSIEHDETQIDSSETQADKPEKNTIQSEVQPETVVIKKRSFLAFVAFLISLAALALSSYSYYLQQQAPQRTAEVAASKDWQKEIDQSESKLTSKINTLSQVHKQNQEKLSSIETEWLSLKSLLQTLKQAEGSSAAVSYDDSALTGKIAAIEQRLTLQKQLITEIQRQISSEFAAIQQNNSTEKTTIQTAQELSIEEVKQNLLAAQRFLSLLQQPEPARKVLLKAQQQLVQMQQADYKNFASELKTVTEEIASKKIDIFAINSELEQLWQQAQRLKTDKTKAVGTNTEKEQSWYNKLITVRKIEEDGASANLALESSVQLNLKSHFALLKIALAQNKQQSWLKQLNAIQSLLEKYFSDNSQSFIEQLQPLKNTNINPEYPDLSGLIQKFNNLNTPSQAGE